MQKGATTSVPGDLPLIVEIADPAASGRATEVGELRMTVRGQPVPWRRQASPAKAPAGPPDSDPPPQAPDKTVPAAPGRGHYGRQRHCATVVTMASNATRVKSNQGQQLIARPLRRCAG